MREPFLEWRDRKLDQAAHAAWLYYIAGNTQEEIAAKLNVSRQAAQRLVALAVSEKLIKFRLDYPLRECIAGGVKKVESILAALHGKSIAGPIADEVVAQAILDNI
jgi:DNA-binding transcriptional regulator LsrR (DeoR family)